MDAKRAACGQAFVQEGRLRPDAETGARQFQQERAGRRDVGPDAVSEPTYVCGHSSGEFDRLQLQGAFFADITRSVFEAAGLRNGFRVLDIGCGAGDVSFLAADIVGSRGSVLGIDRAAEAIAVARSRARIVGYSNVAFSCGTVDPIDAVATDRRYDALVGRFVLMHQANPSALLNAGARCVRAGGLVIFLESALSASASGVHSVPYSPTYDRSLRLIRDTLAAAGAD